MSSRTFAGARSAKVQTVGWSARGQDGLRRTTPAQVTSRILPKLVPGAVVLLHDARELVSEHDSPPAGTLALREILQAMQERSLLALTLDELAQHGSQS